MVIFAHVRKLKDSGRYAECVSSLTDEQTHQLDVFLSRVQGRPASSSTHPPSKRARQAPACESSEEDPCQSFS
eukprot:9317922-Alexandrium_andersonii.AAC.1